jgi:hypothetical protein
MPTATTYNRRVDLSTDDLSALQHARHLLENTSLAARLAQAIGTPVEKLFGMLPVGAADIVLAATNKSLAAGLRFALSTMEEEPVPSSNWAHKAAVAASGAAGGAFGMTMLALELPVSTVIMLRSIADVARSEGESISNPETSLACLQVFALGGPKSGDDAAESAYFAVRAALAKALAEAAEHLAERGLAQQGAPALLRFTSQIAARFGIPVSEKMIAQSVPVIGAAGGAMINLLFIQHFQDLARGHFTVRRLERKYGTATVKSAYLGLAAAREG